MVDGEPGETAICVEKTPAFRPLSQNLSIYASGKSSITELKDSGSEAGMTKEFPLSTPQKNGIQNENF